MTQRIGIETPHGMVYLGDMVMVPYSKHPRKLEHIFIHGKSGEMCAQWEADRSSGGWDYVKSIRPIPQKTVRDMTDDEILDLAEDPKVWFRESDRDMLRRCHMAGGEMHLTGLGLVNRKFVTYTRDRGKTWNKLEVEE